MHVSEHDQFPRGIRHTKKLEWLLVLWATTLAVLNPLACFFYCAVLHAHVGDTHIQSMFFVCDMSDSTQHHALKQNAETSLPHAPLALYPGLGVVAASLVVVFDKQRRIFPQPSPLVSHVLLVKSPPPKISC